MSATIVSATIMSATSVSAHGVPNPAPPTGQRGELSAMSCPVDGESSFIDDWGAGRPGGRRHKGVDMVSDRGTPIVAALAGSAEFKNSRAGGKSVWLRTADGNKFFYAHLDGWAGESRDVERGEVIGFVGSSGNARGAHLHFEIHPGGTPENPFPLTDQACSEPLETPALGIEWWLVAGESGAPRPSTGSPGSTTDLGPVFAGQNRSRNS
jgi:murein DD-endopeptidase MepM/ murein hydrolase activator NlpD